MKIVTAASLIDRFGIDYFLGASVFGAMVPTAVEYLLNEGRVMALDEGDVLFSPGDRADKFFVVLHGSLAFYHFHLGEFAYLRDHPFGEELGFVGMIALHDRVGRAVAAQDSHVLEISCTVFHQLHKAMPSEFGLFLLNLSREMARTIRDVSDLVVVNEIAKRAANETVCE